MDKISRTKQDTENTSINLNTWKPEWAKPEKSFLSVLCKLLTHNFLASISIIKSIYFSLSFLHLAKVALALRRVLCI